MSKLQLLIICLTFSLSFANDCQIRYDFDASIDSSEWHTCNWLNSFTSANEELIYDCGGVPQFGGYEQFGMDAWAQTAIIAIPSHTAVNIKLTLLAIDSWDAEYFYVYADGAKVYEEQFNWAVGTGDISCGGSWLERTSEISITVDHSASVLEIYLTSDLDQAATDESWGFSNFIVEYVTDGECAVYEDLDECNESILSDQNLCPLFNDLDQLTLTVFELQTADAWTLDTTNDELFTLCDQYHMLGGYGVFGSGAVAETRIENIPAHEYLHLKLTFYSIDSWDLESYYIYLNDELIIQKAQQYNDGTDICGSGYGERINYHDIIIPHTDDLAIFTISTTLDQSSTDESWGFSDFVVEYYTTDDCYWGYDDVPTVETLLGKNECLLKCELGQNQVEDYTTQDISGWVFNNEEQDNVFNTCGDDYSMIGGYGVFGKDASASTDLYGLPEHEFIAITFTAFIGESWDNEYFEVYVDDVQVKHENFYYVDSPENNCGNSMYNEQFASIELWIPHNSDTIDIKLTSTLDQGSTDENWGFSDFKLTYFTDDDCGEYASAATCWFNVLDCDVVTVYEFCDYTGRRVEVDGKVDCMDWDPQAICIPAGESATIYDLCWYDGGDITLTESSACLSTGSIGTGLLQKNEDAKKNKKVKQHGLNSVVEVHH